ncbi:hypothetical protein RHSIM_Rhsim03G0158900 [Rhododendron simsii]|uniref:DRBM domain-containing protein n=1 Tax=Rhododendron simsii TaxID=118357 RepID=A0A834H672_RHOSS|nr:hypothetical protein RHSIM_Rhsim03G0158900 [Rhododendron simsii]
MYKTELNSLCQQKSWDFQDYSFTKCGPDHAPSFIATTTVSGIPFTTAADSMTLKEVENKCAKIAPNHFSRVSTSSSLSPEFFLTIKEAKYATAKVALESLSVNEVQELHTYGETSNIVGVGLGRMGGGGGGTSNPLTDPAAIGMGFDGRLPLHAMPRMSRETIPLPPDASNTLYVEGLPSDITRREVALLEEARPKVPLWLWASVLWEEVDRLPMRAPPDRKLWDLPDYSFTKCGPDHAPSFIATVSGVSFTTVDDNTTLKETENKCAKIALHHFPRPPYAIQFKSTVKIDGKLCRSPEFSLTIKEAKSAATKVALELLSINEVQEVNDSGLFMYLFNLLMGEASNIAGVGLGRMGGGGGTGMGFGGRLLMDTLSGGRMCFDGRLLVDAWNGGGMGFNGSLPVDAWSGEDMGFAGMASSSCDTQNESLKLRFVCYKIDEHNRDSACLPLQFSKNPGPRSAFGSVPQSCGKR